MFSLFNLLFKPKKTDYSSALITQVCYCEDPNLTKCFELSSFDRLFSTSHLEITDGKITYRQYIASGCIYFYTVENITHLIELPKNIELRGSFTCYIVDTCLINNKGNHSPRNVKALKIPEKFVGLAVFLNYIKSMAKS